MFWAAIRKNKAHANACKQVGSLWVSDNDWPSPSVNGSKGEIISQKGSSGAPLLVCRSETSKCNGFFLFESKRGRWPRSMRQRSRELFCRENENSKTSLTKVGNILQIYWREEAGQHQLQSCQLHQNNPSTFWWVSCLLLSFSGCHQCIMAFDARDLKLPSLMCTVSQAQSAPVNLGKIFLRDFLLSRFSRSTTSWKLMSEVMSEIPLCLAIPMQISGSDNTGPQVRFKY